MRRGVRRAAVSDIVAPTAGGRADHHQESGALQSPAYHERGSVSSEHPELLTRHLSGVKHTASATALFR